jgi:DNA-binding response OmpR family regulator
MVAADEADRIHSFESAPMTAERVLIVEDFVDSRDMYMEFLQAQGFEVIGAEDGLAALRAIETSAPDVVVLDVALPKLDGLSVLRKLRADARYARLPVLTLSASLGADYQQAAMAAGATAALEKPCLPEELLAALRKVLKERH